MFVKNFTTNASLKKLVQQHVRITGYVRKMQDGDCSEPDGCGHGAHPKLRLPHVSGETQP